MRLSCDGLCASSAWIAADAPPEALLPASACEFVNFLQRRQHFCERLVALQTAGLDVQIAVALLRTKTSADAQYLAASVGLPGAIRQQIDNTVMQTFVALTKWMEPLTEIQLARLFQPLKDGGLGFASTHHYADAALANSWAACLPGVMQQMAVNSAEALSIEAPRLGDHLKQVDTRVGGQLSKWISGAPDAEAQLRPYKGLLAAVARKKEHDALMARASPEEAAVWRSSGGTGAGAWLETPSMPSHRLDDVHYNIALRLRLHADVLPGGLQCQHRSAQNGTCGAALDRRGVHACTCLRGGWAIQRHDQCRNSLYRSLDDLCEASVTQEQVTPQARASGEPRLDIVVAGLDGRRLRLDVAATHCLTEAAMRGGGAARRDGIAAAQMEAHKRHSYPGIRVTPAVVETHGRLGTSLLTFIRQAYGSLDDDERVAAVRATYRSFAVALQYGSAQSIIRAAAVTHHRGG